MIVRVVALLLISCVAYAQARSDYPGRVPRPRRNVQAPASLPPSIGGYGDSILAGFCNSLSPIAKLASLLDGHTFANLAQAGTTTSQISARYFATRDTACAGERCGTYVFQGGVNNCHSLHSCDPAVMLSDMLSAIDDARSLTRRVIVTNIAPFVDCSPCAGPTDVGWELAKEYNDGLALACAGRPDITCIDVGHQSDWEAPFLDGILRLAWSCDGIHWLQGGADAWAAEARSAFE